MRTLVENLTSLSWWVTVVIVGLLVNIAAAYVKPRLDRFLGNISGSRRARNDAKMAERGRMVTRLRSSHHEQVLTFLTELRWMSRAIIFLLLGLAIFQVAIRSTHDWFVAANFFLGACVFVLAYLCLDAAFAARDLLRDARSIDMGGPPPHSVGCTVVHAGEVSAGKEGMEHG